VSPSSSSNKIGTLQETSLHASLKNHYSRPGDKLEEKVAGYVIDIIQDSLLIEIQTSNFSSMRKKLANLLKDHKVKLVHPIARDKWIVRESPDGQTVIGRRRSPKRLQFINVFEELVSIGHLLGHSNFELEVILIQEEEIRRHDGRGSWRRRGWSIIDHKLLDILESRIFNRPEDYLSFLPEDLEEPFTNADLAKSAMISRRLAEKMTYALRKMGVLSIAGKRGRANLFIRLPKYRHKT
jgi:hypothetical protein